MPIVSIETPATTANFGPGFDCVGIALELSNELTVQWGEVQVVDSDLDYLRELKRRTHIEIFGEGAEELASSGVGLFYQSLAYLLKPCNLLPTKLEVEMKNQIPLSRGLGSSAAGIVGALCLGRVILASTGVFVEMADLARAAVNLEGHPDNVLPALYGGAGVNIFRKDTFPLYLPFEVPAELRLVLAVPNIQISTTAARRVLPDKVDLSAATENTALLGGLLLSLAKGDYQYLQHLLQGPLHVPYRSRMIPGYTQVEAAALGSGALAVTISGSGPTVLALTTKDPDLVGESMVNAFAVHASLDSFYVVSGVEPKGARVIEKGQEV